MLLGVSLLGKPLFSRLNDVGLPREGGVVVVYVIALSIVYGVDRVILFWRQRRIVNGRGDR